MFIVKLRNTHACLVLCENGIEKNDDLEDLTDFKQPPKKKAQFKYPSKEEELLALY